MLSSSSLRPVYDGGELVVHASRVKRTEQGCSVEFEVQTPEGMAAAELSAQGLSTRTMPREDVMGAAMDFAQVLAARDPPAVRTVKARANWRLVEIWREPDNRQRYE